MTGEYQLPSANTLAACIAGQTVRKGRQPAGPTLRTVAAAALFCRLPCAGGAGTLRYALSANCCLPCTDLQIRTIDRVCEIPHEGPFCDLMWSDPEDIETWAVSPRGAGWLFGRKVTSEFNQINGEPCAAAWVTSRDS
jgi:hypothetical protein